ncbi:MAG TPA: flagellin [Polyangia bacterium]|nr:flagellin [Polyangia bacterium]
MLSIQTNIAALSAQNALTSSNNNLQKSMERLSSGFRINHAADDAAGLAISEKMQAQIGGLNQAVRNANDGASMIQTAEGALDQIQNMMVRMRNLAVQAASDTQGPTERSDINVEIQQLKLEIDNISLRTSFNGLKLLNGSMVGTGVSLNAATSTANTGLVVGGGAITSVSVAGAKAATTYTLTADAVNHTLTLSDIATNPLNPTTSTLSVAAGVGANSSLTLNFASLGVSFTVSAAATVVTAANLEGLAAKTFVTAAAGATQDATLQTGADAGSSNQTTVKLLNTQLTNATAGTKMADLNTAIVDYATAAGTLAGPTDAQATTLITTIDAANDWISGQRASLGAAQNRLGYAAASLTTTSQNVSAANSQVRDVDVASETSNMSKSQILMQAGVSVLAQANQVQQLALKLLG